MTNAEFIRHETPWTEKRKEDYNQANREASKSFPRKPLSVFPKPQFAKSLTHSFGVNFVAVLIEEGRRYILA
ncbi:hypothetical protein Pr1d_36670 [Bythopirellula goksoeyrii]|uniref:Uncharacterized protein n=1 Tax=Bythopirellula goksoeyrii TaxID=1400387 RepID=A0A5B9QQV5_9BACT|nr:hypothetical protein Pr1d_36670 [Bythopirellula goksoeyrii]